MRPIRTIHVVLLTLVLAGVLTGMARAGETEEAPEETVNAAPELPHGCGQAFVA